MSVRPSLARALFATLLVAPAGALIALDAPAAATGYACGLGKPNLAAKRCDCPVGKVEFTNAKGTSTCVDPSKPTGSASVKPKPAASTSASAAPISKCPSGMVEIPGGTFPLEETKATMKVPTFCVDMFETTVMQYGFCVTANACVKPAAYSADAKSGNAGCNFGAPGRVVHPINCVSWDEASSYCSFVGKRLMTDEEFEWLARNGDQATEYPWGAGAPDDTRANACGAECPPHFVGYANRALKAMYPTDDGFAETAPVGSFLKGKNRWGVLDLAGNVWEWTSTSDVSPKDGTPMKIMRGGSFLSEDVTMLKSGLRAVEKSSQRGWQIGFRCAKTI